MVGVECLRRALRKEERFRWLEDRHEGSHDSEHRFDMNG